MLNKGIGESENGWIGQRLIVLYSDCAVFYINITLAKILIYIEFLVCGNYVGEKKLLTHFNNYLSY